MLCKLIERAQMKDKDAMLELIDRFYPLLKKYATKLSYDDAYQDLVLYYIEFVLKLRLDALTSLKDEAIVSYIKVVVVNYYKKKIQKIIASNKELIQSDLTQEQAYYMEARLARHDPVNVLMEFGIEERLNHYEYQVIRLIYVDGYTPAEIARILKKTRQAVNQLKHRALQKLKDTMI